MVFGGNFVFIVNGVAFASNVVEATVLSPAVLAQLSVDACARNFLISDNQIDPADFFFLQRLISGEAIFARKSHRRSVVLLCQQLYNAQLEQLIFCACSSPLANDTVFDFSNATAATPVDLHSVLQFLPISVDAFDTLLSSKELSITSEDELFCRILALGSAYAPLLRHVSFALLSLEGILGTVKSLIELCPMESIWPGIADRTKREIASPLDSLIVSTFPALLDEFRWKPIKLLSHGSRNGFGATDFHSRCDGHANTLTLILDTHANIFGGFTPVQWESPWSSRIKGDDSLKSFLFTLRNPHGIPARKFPLKFGEKHNAIDCDRRFGPIFGVDVYIFDECNTHTDNHTDSFGDSYANDTGLKGMNVFACSHGFTVKEMEVFEVADETSSAQH
jgi:hypothetical protein